jgi:hypothetical protein
MTEPFVRPGTYLVVVNRGNMQSVFPFGELELSKVQGHHLALAAAQQFSLLQSGHPKDKPTLPIDPKSRIALALQYTDTKEYLRADISLAAQFEGRWLEEEVPEILRNQYHGKAPYVELNLVDTPLLMR